MMSAFYRFCATLLLVALFNSHIAGPLWALPGDGSFSGERFAGPYGPPRPPLIVPQDQAQTLSLLLEHLQDHSHVPASPLPTLTPFAAERYQQARSPLATWGLRAITAFLAAWVPLGYGQTVIFSTPIEALVNVPLNTSVPPVPPSLWALAIPTALASTPETVTLIHQALEGLDQRVRDDRDATAPSSCASCSHAPKDVLYYGALVTATLALSAKMGFVYLTNLLLPPYPPESIPWVSVAAAALLPVGVSQALQSYRVAQSGLRKFPRPLTPPELALQDSLARAHHHITHSPLQAIALLNTLESLTATHRTHEKVLDQEIAHLRAHPPQDQARLTLLETTRAHMAKTLYAMQLQAIHHFASTKDTPETAPSPPSWGQRLQRALFGSEQHDRRDKAAKALGALPGLLASVSLYYSFLYIWSEILSSPSAQVGLAITSAIPYALFAGNAMGNQIRTLVRFFRNYDPTGPEGKVTTSALHYGKRRALVELFDWGRRIAVGLPISTLAGLGMGLAGFSEGPFSQFFFSLNAIVIGATLPSVTQEKFTATARRGTRDPGRRAQLTLGTLFEDLANNIRDKGPGEAQRLYNLMTTSPQQWFAPVQVVVEGAPEMPAHSTQTAQTPPISIARSPLDPQALSLGSSGGPTAPPLETGSRSRTPSPPESPPKESALNGPRRSPPRNAPVPLRPLNSFGAYPDRDNETAAPSDDSGLTATLLKKPPSPPQEGRLRKIWRALFGNKK